RVSHQILDLTCSTSKFNLQCSRAYTADAPKHHKVVLIGAHQSNPWVGQFTDRLSFDMDYDPVHHRPIVSNRTPQQGEPKEYPVVLGRPESVTGYAVIAYVPDVTAKSKVLILAGTDSQATGAAGDFVTSADTMAALE